MIQQQANIRTSFSPSAAMIDLGSQAGKPDPRILFLIRELDHMPAVTASTNKMTSAIFISWFGPAKTIPAVMILLSIAVN